MRAAYSAVVLGAIGASAVAMPEVEARAATATAGNWYFYSFEPSCGSSFGCNTDYIVFAPEGAAGAGAPAFGLRCNTWGSCENVYGGSDVSTAFFQVNQGPVGVTQKFTSGGKTKTATVSIAWDGNSKTSGIIPVTVS
ncbi:hypothetical protein F5Y14DRAFT_455529 [Nemania sp. NC0429]|nr:hypothetical protein F5Y14DRAFT_455529 [Nemania sp. NC0429]